MRTILLAALLATVAGCSDTVISNGTVGGAWGRWRDVPVTYTTGDVRAITERESPVDPGRHIICTEPAPDVAKALAATAAAAASGGGGGVSGSASGGFASAEALLELAGRSTALLGLRDGLYRACEAYANGAIGDSAYSLVLSRYGHLMIALFLGQDISGLAAAGGGTVAAPPVTINLPAGAAPAKDGGGGADKKSAQAARDGVPFLVAAAAMDPPPAKSPREPAAGPGVNTAAAEALRAIALAYFNLDKESELHFLLVGCMNEFDSSRPVIHARTDQSGQNWFLRQLCTGFVSAVSGQNPAALAAFKTLFPRADAARPDGAKRPRP